MNEYEAAASLNARSCGQVRSLDSCVPRGCAKFYDRRVDFISCKIFLFQKRQLIAQSGLFSKKPLKRIPFVEQFF
jgi:hypothetical protein